MHIIFTTLLCMVLAYFLGAVPFSFLVARANGVDLRTIGSGNIGSANVWRSCGFGAFVLALTLDALKGAAVPLLAIYALGLPPLAVILIGASAMLGHTFSIYLGFRGGKAVATSAGVLLAIAPWIMLLAAITWGVVVALTRITSLGSLSAAVLVMVLALLGLGMGWVEPTYTAFMCLAGGAVVVLHRSNIRRLLDGTENRVQRFF